MNAVVSEEIAEEYEVLVRALPAGATERDLPAALALTPGLSGLSAPRTRYLGLGRSSECWAMRSW